MIRWFKRWPGNFGIFTFMIDVAGTGVQRPLGAGRPGNRPSSLHSRAERRIAVNKLTMFCLRLVPAKPQNYCRQ